MKKIYLPFLVFFFVGCSGITVVQTNPSLQNPETSHDGQLSFLIASDSAEKIDFTDDASARPPVVNIVQTTVNDLRGQINYGLNNRWEISGGANSDGAGIFNSKFRFYGGDNGENGFIATLTLFLSYNSTSRSGNQEGEFGPGGYPWKATGTAYLGSGGLALGYRASDAFLVFANSGAGNAKATLAIKQDAANGDAGGAYSIESKASIVNYGLGVTVGKNTRVTLGISQTLKKWTNSAFQDKTSTNGIFIIGF